MACDDCSNLDSLLLHSVWLEASQYFNGDLSKWDTSKVSTLEGSKSDGWSGQVTDVMIVLDLDSSTVLVKGFELKFNGDLSKWDTSKVSTLSLTVSPMMECGR